MTRNKTIKGLILYQYLFVYLVVILLSSCNGDTVDPPPLILSNASICELTQVPHGRDFYTCILAATNEEVKPIIVSFYFSFQCIGLVERSEYHHNEVKFEPEEKKEFNKIDPACTGMTGGYPDMDVLLKDWRYE